MSIIATAIAATAIVVGGTGTGYLPTPSNEAMHGFVTPTIGSGHPIEQYVYPGAPWDVPQASSAGLSTMIDKAGPGTTVVAISKGAQVARYTQVISPAPPHSVSYVLIGDPDRKGGLLSRMHMDHPYPFRYNTTEIYGQYDGFADWPDKPLNIVADINAIAGIITVHAQYGNGSAADPLTHLDRAVVSTHRNPNGTTTTTKMVPTKQLPIVTLLRGLGLPKVPAAQLNHFLKPIVDAGYSRTPRHTMPKPKPAHVRKHR